MSYGKYLYALKDSSSTTTTGIGFFEPGEGFGMFLKSEELSFSSGHSFFYELDFLQCFVWNLSFKFFFSLHEVKVWNCTWRYHHVVVVYLLWKFKEMEQFASCFLVFLETGNSTKFLLTKMLTALVNFGAKCNSISQERNWGMLFYLKRPSVDWLFVAKWAAECDKWPWLPLLTEALTYRGVKPSNVSTRDFHHYHQNIQNASL